MIKRLILVTGMPGSGKSVVREIANELGISILIMGDVIREEVKSRGLKEEAKSYEFVMRDIRAKLSDRIVAERTAKKLNYIKADIAFIDGVRSLEEVRYFRKIAEDVHVLALLSPFRIRLKRLSSRKRSGDPKTEKELEERDEAELKLGLGDVIAKADSYIVNDDRPIEVFKEDLRKTMIRLMKSS
ncbi:MAG: AAA family ATPase [archaeon]|nr:AAA family ATPase [archaeon]MCP8322197.1 AAA family ATPase [archaeon]